MKDFSNEIWAYALKNSVEFGKADAGRIMPKLFQHGLDKKDIKDVMPEIQRIVKEVNGLNQKQKEEKLEKYKSYAKETEKRDENELPELENVKGKVITRLAPEPSKYNHLGHALVFLIQYLYAKKYDGECILRFDDTNPEKSAKEYYDAMKEDLAWIGIKWDKEFIASNNMQKYYDYCEKLIKDNNAFICSCGQEEMRKLREEMKECKCRNKSSKENLTEWKLMLDGKFKEGERTVRLKGDMKSNNGVMRDPVIFRISYAEHFIQKKKYCVWPMYDFENPIEDATSGVTHVIRTNEFELRAELHELILKLLGLKAPIIREIGRYQVTGAETQGRVIREMIEKKEINGWDDPRLVTVKALRRRGFVPAMFQELAKRVGLSKSSGHIDMTVLSAINRSLVDSTAKRLYFVSEPIKLEIKDQPSIKQVELPILPNSEEKRKLKIGEIFISKDDFDNLKGKEIRLLHLFNIKLGNKIEKGVVKAEYTGDEIKEGAKIHWVSDYIPAKVMMADGQFKEGYLETSADKLKVGEISQFERFGFVRKDKDGKVPEFWFAH
jgi:glutamyl-tRNA synthetase